MAKGKINPLILMIGIAIGISSCQNSDNQTDDAKTSISTEETIEGVLELVGKQEIVKEHIKLIDSLSNNQRRISLIPFLKDTTKNIYLVT